MENASQRNPQGHCSCSMVRGFAQQLILMSYILQVLFICFTLKLQRLLVSTYSISNLTLQAGEFRFSIFCTEFFISISMCGTPRVLIFLHKRHARPVGPGACELLALWRESLSNILHLQYFNLFFIIFGSGFSHSNYEGLSSFWQRKRGTRGESSRCAIIASLSACLLPCQSCSSPPCSGCFSMFP